ncbi:hypothetical protein HG536_0B06540 [Torulaspora globosa]|uniref:Enhancer of polycomb-like protein n=1 Tax=Torulaspora globosa TaxID=48254 RepID=A0A7G3ZE50_9SACH|nr:uncharacterized protein HG536_0B06540 [Torulaspora globosa]QLL31786.1 hypothetical protein HG536_0B06540 [Torulaspora globosa]
MPTPTTASATAGSSTTNSRHVKSRAESQDSHDEGTGPPGSGSADNSNSRFRHRKISVRQRLRILKPCDLKSLDQEELQQRDVADIETGVEKNEEKEVHLHRILQKGSSHLNNQRKEYIPTPDASSTWSEFDQFYRGHFAEPNGYIKFSATVEDCCGAPYCMDEVDEEFLNELRSRYEGDDKLTEDEFEVMCSSFDSAIHARQPFLSTDPQSILSFDEIKPTLVKSDYAHVQLKSSLANEIGLDSDRQFVTQFDSKANLKTRALTVLLEKFGPDVYEHWKRRKLASPSTEIFPQLKFERPDEKDDVDPYVCFRRRDVRQARKTRRVDILNSQKLRLLHQELQHAKKMALLVARREKMSMDLLEKSLTIFDQRSEVKKLKRSLNIRGEDDDLVNHKRKRLDIFAHQRKLQEQAAAEAAAMATTSDSSVRRGYRNKMNRKEIESLTKSGQRLTKQQIQQLQHQSAAAIGNNKQKQDAKLAQVQAEQQQQLQQQQQNVASHVYVRLPSSKVPDLTLEDVDNLLANKEKNAKKFVHDRMEKRKMEDGDVFFNLTDDPYNPVFDITLPKGVSPSNAPFSSIASSRFEVSRSYYSKHLADYLKGSTKDVTAFSRDGEKLPQNNFKVKKVEVYDPFQNNNEIHSREYPVKFRRRIGRCGIQYMDRKPNKIHHSVEFVLSQFLDFDAIEKHEMGADQTINVYDSKWDELSRLYSKWKYDSPRNEYGLKISEEPSRLNRISNDAQVIRFGTMLGSKSYEQLREVTVKYRQEYISRMKQQKINNQKQLQLQQLQRQQKEQEFRQDDQASVDGPSIADSSPSMESMASTVEASRNTK